MRRVLAAISNNMNTGDISTLANPDVVEKVREMAQGKEQVALADGPEDLKKFGDGGLRRRKIKERKIKY